MLVDCRVNVFDDNHMLPLFRALSSIARPCGIGLKSDADTPARELVRVDKAIIFSLRYNGSIGIDGDDEITARGGKISGQVRGLRLHWSARPIVWTY